MEIQGLDHLELYAADAEKTAASLAERFGFAVHGRSPVAAPASVLLGQGEIRLLVTQPGHGQDAAAAYVERHGAGVAVIGLRVPDAGAAFAEAVERGAQPVGPPRRLGPVTFASVVAFGDVEHRFVSRSDETVFAPGLIEDIAPAEPARDVVHVIDHLAVCLPAGELRPVIDRHREILGFVEIFTEHIVVGEQAMESIVIQDPGGFVTLTMIEPDTSRAPGQIDQFVADHDGAGVQHVALLTGDIAGAVRDAQTHGVRFLSTPAEYYEALPGRLGPIGADISTLQELNVLADRDHSGVMLQIFTASAHERRTLFWELIERRGARTFGTNNISALYEAVERGRTRDGGAAKA